MRKNKKGRKIMNRKENGSGQPEEMTEEILEEAPEQETPQPEEPAAKAEEQEQPEAAPQGPTPLEKAEAKAAEYLAMAQRVQADFENFRRRNESVRADAYADGRKDVAAVMLPVLDNLERAAAAPEGEGYKAGVEMVLRGLLQTIEQMGVQEIAADGQPFDPQLHNAVAREDADGVAPDTVTLVLQKGYKMGERVLRPAMVKVAN